MSTVTDRIGNLEVRDNAVAANAERLPYEVWDTDHPNYNYPILVATFTNRVDAIGWANSQVGNDAEEFELSGYNEDMDGDFDSGMASAGHGTDEDYGHYGDDY